MAQVMIDLPDDLVGRIDAYARQMRTTRSDFVRDLAKRELRYASEARRERIRELLDRPSRGYGGRATEYIREMRDAR
ncbi:ribbon-helix-helix protein, CopG family [Conexibacter sp. CPCC 206217]|uniref:ribbon-helix-helix protein, CopG family n=1 Tax=Conexibacter sp. CPCC 206217 TaxID=3064574 RepID=UPI0027192D05|nr:ribbon-helix-helix protein, CopG family [Conexibacter sp. CPCC 206217]MDO8211318.1 ribbon-helix-helix protein, CopG family [Conexibacter sp. CPCC 206217]